jgi:hypothetical protein
VLLQVLRGPVGVLEKGEKAVHHDAQEHGGGPQGIEVVVAGGAAHVGESFPGLEPDNKDGVVNFLEAGPLPEHPG